jgi:hypothetical protein
MANPTDPMVTPGWNTQTSTGDEEVGGVGSATTGLLGPNEAIMQGFLAQTADPAEIVHAGAALATTADIYMAKLYLPTPLYCTNINLWCTTAGNATVLNLGLFSSAGALLASTGDVHGSLSSGSLLTGALSAKTTLPAGFCYVAVGNVGSTTAFNAITYSATFASAGLTAAGSMTLASLATPQAQRWFVGGTGFATTFPASLTAAQFAATTIGFWAALS